MTVTRLKRGCTVAVSFLPVLFLLSRNALPAYVQIVFGIIAVLVLPGFFIMSLIVNRFGILEAGLSAIVGLVWNCSVIAFVFGISPVFGLRLPLFDVIVFSSTAIALTLSGRLARASWESKISLSGLALLLLFVLGFVLRFWFSELSTVPTTDGSVMMDMARLLVQTNQFTSHFEFPPYPGYYVSGLNPSLIVYFVEALFFWISHVSFEIAKLSILFLGSLLIFPIYAIVDHFAGKLAAFLAASIATLQPHLVLFSAVPAGPEIMGALWTFSAFFLVVYSTSTGNKVAAIVAGALAFLSALTWDANYWALIAVLALYYMFPVWPVTKRTILGPALLLLTALYMRFAFVLLNPLVLVAFAVCLPSLFVLLRRQGSHDLSLFAASNLVIFTVYSLHNLAVGAPLSADPVLTSYLPTIPSFTSILNSLQVYWSALQVYGSALADNFSYPLLALAAFSFLYPKRRLILATTAFAAIEALGFAFYISMGFEERFLVSAEAFLIVPSAVGLYLLITRVVSAPTHAASKGKRATHSASKGKRARPSVLHAESRNSWFRSGLTCIAIVLLIGPSFSGGYSHATSFIVNYWDAPWQGWWGNPSNTTLVDGLTGILHQNNSVITYEPEWAWILNTSVIFLPPQVDSLNGLESVILETHSNYLLVDAPFVQNHPNLGYLYARGGTTLPGFAPVFWTQVGENYVILYRVHGSMNESSLFLSKRVLDVNSIYDITNPASKPFIAELPLQSRFELPSSGLVVVDAKTNQSQVNLRVNFFDGKGGYEYFEFQTSPSSSLTEYYAAIAAPKYATRNFNSTNVVSIEFDVFYSGPSQSLSVELSSIAVLYPKTS